jgi:hypothetical protein
MDPFLLLSLAALFAAWGIAVVEEYHHGGNLKSGSLKEESLRRET